MKTRADRILLAVLLVTAALYALVWVTLLFFYTESDLLGVLALWTHAVPVFCLQLLLCRNVKWWLPRLTPLLLALLAVAFCLWKMAGAEGWDGVFWAFLLLLTLAPLLGCGAAWAVYGVQRFRGRANK